MAGVGAAIIFGVTSVPPIGLIIAALLGFGLEALLASTATDDSTATAGGIILLVSAIAFIAGCERAWKERARRQ